MSSPSAKNRPWDKSRTAADEPGAIRVEAWLHAHERSPKHARGSGSQQSFGLGAARFQGPDRLKRAIRLVFTDHS